MADKYMAHKDCGIHATYERNPCPHCESDRLSKALNDISMIPMVENSWEKTLRRAVDIARAAVLTSHKESK